MTEDTTEKIAQQRDQWKLLYENMKESANKAQAGWKEANQTANEYKKLINEFHENFLEMEQVAEAWRKLFEAEEKRPIRHIIFRRIMGWRKCIPLK